MSTNKKPSIRFGIVTIDSFNDYKKFEKELNKYLVSSKQIIHPVIIDLPNLDSLFSRYAMEYLYNFKVFTIDINDPPSIKIKRRNESFINDVQCLIAFWDNKDPIIRNIILLAQVKKIPVKIIPI